MVWWSQGGKDGGGQGMGVVGSRGCWNQGLGRSRGGGG